MNLKHILLPLILLAGAAVSSSCSLATEKYNDNSTNRTQVNLFESYLVPPNEYRGNWDNISLKTIKNFKGNESSEYVFEADNTPWILNAGYEVTSKISSTFEIYVWKDFVENAGFTIGSGPIIQTSRTGISATIGEEKGKFTIQVKSSGCKWWIKIGVE